MSSLKEQLMQKMNGGGSEEELVEDTITTEDILTESSEPDLSSIFEDSEPEITEVPDIDTDGIEIDEPELVSYTETESVTEIDEATYVDPEPTSIYSVPEIDEPAFDEPTVSTHASYSSESSELGNKLVKKAKKTILLNVQETYNSELFTSALVNKLIKAYLDEEDWGVTNGDAIFIAFIDEVIDSDYEHDYYKDLGVEVLTSIKEDVN